MEERTMNAQRSLSRSRAATVVGLVVGALGIAILWASGVEFPIYPPPGTVILFAGAVFAALAPWRWAAGVGAFLGLFVFAGFLISPTGLSNLFGQAGTGIAIGQGVQVLGVLTAMIAGVITTRANYRKQARAAQ
jgi:K+-sensing histidine kinase KdpD